MIQARICGDRPRIAVIGMWEHIGLGFFGIYQTLLTCVLGTSKCISTWCWFATFIIAAITLLLLVFEQSGGHVRIFMHVLCIWCYNIYIYNIYIYNLYIIISAFIWSRAEKTASGEKSNKGRNFSLFSLGLKRTPSRRCMCDHVYIYIYMYIVYCVYDGENM